MRLYNLTSGPLTSTTAGLAIITFPQSGTIVGVSFSVFDSSQNSTSVIATAAFELSFQSASQFQVNDSSGIICTFVCQGSFTTSGANNGFANGWKGPMAIPIKAGDKIYLHVNEGGANGWNVAVQLHVR